MSRAQSSRRSLPEMSRAELAWLVGATAIILLLTQVPPTVERLVGPPHRVHIGTYLYVQDFANYLATMREAASSPSWLVHNHFSPEPHAPALWFPLYVAIGKLSSATGLPILGVYAAVELLSRVVLCISLYVFVSAFLSGTGPRRLAFVLATIGGGLAIWERGIELILELPPLLSIKGAAEYLTFTTFFLAPHLMLGLAGILMALVWFSAARDGSTRSLWLLGGCVLAISLVHSFTLPVLLATFGVYELGRWLAQRRVDASGVLPGAVTAVAAAPIALYNTAIFRTDPFWGASYNVAIVFFPARPWELPIDYGVVFLLAVVGIAHLWRTGWSSESDAEPALLVVFASVALALSLLPVYFGNRFILGIQPAFAVLAVYGWDPTRRWAARLLERLYVPRERAGALAGRTLTYGVVVLAAGTAFVVYISVVLAMASDAPSSQYRLTRQSYELGEWLAEHTGEDDVIAASPTSGNVFGGMVRGRVVAAFIVAPGFYEKMDQLNAMYRGELGTVELRAFLAANRVSHLVVGPEERMVGPFDPGAELGFPIAMRVGDAVAYRVPPSVSHATRSPS